MNIRHLVSWGARVAARAASGLVSSIGLVAVGGISVLLMAASAAEALEPVVVSPEEGRIEITSAAELIQGRGDKIQVDTVAGVDGTSGSITVQSITPGTNPNWLVFALTNPTGKPQERWITAERYNLIGSGIVWPDLDARRMEFITASQGYLPERVANDRADVFRITIDPQSTVTYAVELASDRRLQVYLWKPFEYELKVRERQLFNGVMLGIVGMVAVFLTAIFIANHKIIFPATALMAWCVLGYLCVDFGFFHKLFQLRPDDNAIYRAATEAAMAASFVIFLSTFLRLNLAQGLAWTLVILWIGGQLTLVGLAVIDPRVASTFARSSFVLIGGVGAIMILYLVALGEKLQDRALSLIPAWIVFLVWIFVAAVVLAGYLPKDVYVSGLVAGLVLTVLLMGFTVTQYAFRALEPLYAATPGESELRSQAVDSAGCAVWEWSSRRDEIKVSGFMERALGLGRGEMNGKTENFLKHIAEEDRERFQLALWSLQERAGGRIRVDLRLRHAGNTSVRWFELVAASVPGTEPNALRCVGLFREITEAKRAHERLLHDAVYCGLTKLPNRALFMDRVAVAIARSKVEKGVSPALFFIDLDKFKSVNAALGPMVGDTILQALARRLQHDVGGQDTLARIGGDQFAILITSWRTMDDLVSQAERLRRSLRSAIKISGREVVLTGSIGIAVYSEMEPHAVDILKNAEIAMYRAKRQGADRIEFFEPSMRSDEAALAIPDGDVQKAIGSQHIAVVYRPVHHLATADLVGFEANVHWQHPKFGLLLPEDFVPALEKFGAVSRLFAYALTRSIQDAARWQKEHPRPDAAPLFVALPLWSPKLFVQDLEQEIRHAADRFGLDRGGLRLEITQEHALENPEQTAELMSAIKGLGVDFVLSDFGRGWSDLAYVQRIPVEMIKIRRGLANLGTPDESHGLNMVRAVAALAHELRRKVIVDDLETSQDMRVFRSTRCDYAQGPVFGDMVMTDRAVMQKLAITRKAHKKLQPRSYFKTKPKKQPLPGQSPSATDTGVQGGDLAAAMAAKRAAQTRRTGEVRQPPPQNLERKPNLEGTPRSAAIAPEKDLKLDPQKDGRSPRKEPPPVLGPLPGSLSARMPPTLAPTPAKDEQPPMPRKKPGVNVPRVPLGNGGPPPVMPVATPVAAPSGPPLSAEQPLVGPPPAMRTPTLGGPRPRMGPPTDPAPGFSALSEGVASNLSKLAGRPLRPLDRVDMNLRAPKSPETVGVPLGRRPMTGAPPIDRQGSPRPPPQSVDEPLPSPDRQGPPPIPPRPRK